MFVSGVVMSAVFISTCLTAWFILYVHVGMPVDLANCKMSFHAERIKQTFPDDCANLQVALLNRTDFLLI